MHQSIDQVNHAEVYLPPSQHPSVSEEKTGTDNETELLSQISILPLPQSLPLAMHSRVDLGAMRHVLLYYLLGTYWKSGVCSEQ